MRCNEVGVFHDSWNCPDCNGPGTTREPCRWCHTEEEWCDCEDRRNCHSVGAPGHTLCGSKDECGCPRFVICNHRTIDSAFIYLFGYDWKHGDKFPCDLAAFAKSKKEHKWYLFPKNPR